MSNQFAVSKLSTMIGELNNVDSVVNSVSKLSTVKRGKDFTVQWAPTILPEPLESNDTEPTESVCLSEQCCIAESLST